MNDLTLLSPGIEVFESEVVVTAPDQVENPAGIVINSSWGPVNTVTYCKNKTELYKKFGLIPSISVGKTLASAESFLDYANGLYVLRALPDTAVGTSVGLEYSSYAVDQGDAIQYNSATLGKDPSDFISKGVGSYFAAKYPGSAGNNIQVFLYSYQGAKNLFDGVEIDVYARSILEQIVKNLGVTKSTLLSYFGRIENDSETIESQKWLMVVTENGNIPDPLYSKGRPAGLYIREFTFAESQTMVRPDVGDFVYQEYFNDNFKLVTARRGLTATNELGPLGMFDPIEGVWASNFATFALNGAKDIADGEEILVKTMGMAYDLFVDTPDMEYIISLPYENIDISKGGRISFPPNVDGPLIEEDLYSWAIAKSMYASIASKSTLTLFSVPKSMLGDVNSSEMIVEYLNEIPGIFANYHGYSYTHIDSSWMNYSTSYTTSGAYYSYELPISSSTAGLMSNTKINTNIWSSSAGFTRGVYKPGTTLVNTVTKLDRDTYYPGCINPILQERDSLILFGNKTYTPGKSLGPLTRVEVRMLMIRIEKAVSTYAKTFLFETNNPATRARFKYLVDQYLSTIKSNGGISEYRVIIDETNNTQDTIAANRLLVNVAVKPVKSINFITLNFDIYDSNMSISEA